MDLRREGQCFRDGLRIAEQVGDASGVRWLRGQLVVTALAEGRWDDSLQAADRFIAECEAGSPHYLESGARSARARQRLGRGDGDGALADHRRAIALARKAGDPQTLMPNLGAAVATFETLGLNEEAASLSVELVASARQHPEEAAWTLAIDFLYMRSASPHGSELREILADAPPLPWKDLAFACLDRDFVRAAELWAAAGSPTWEARLRLRAAEELIEAGRRHDGEVELRKALAFYRTVGATFFIERGETLLAKSA